MEDVHANELRDERMKKSKKGMILHLLMCVVVILIGIGYIPIKCAVYADKDTIYAYDNGEMTLMERRKYSRHTVVEWYEKEKYNIANIVEAVMLADRPKLKLSGTNYIGHVADWNPALYFEVQDNSPIERLNANFDPGKVKNYYAIKYWSIYGDDPAEWKDGYLEDTIVITDWTPIYPIQRSGWLASRLLPKSYLTIWDFIG